MDSDSLLMKNEGTINDENHSDLYMDTSHNLTASQLMSTSMDNLNSNSQSGFANYFSSASFGDEGQENNEMISPTINGNDPSASLKRRKKSDKDVKLVKIQKILLRFFSEFFL